MDASKIEQLRKDVQLGKDLYKKVLRNEDFADPSIALSDIDYVNSNKFNETDEIYNHNGTDYKVYKKGDKKYIRNGLNGYTDLSIYTKEHNIGAMPTFCPICKKFMRYGVDQASYHSYQMCHRCWSEKETRMKLDGTWDDWNMIQTYKTRKDKILEYIIQLEEKKNIDPKNMTMGVTEMGDVLKYEMHNPEEFFEKLDNEIKRAKILIEVYDQVINNEIKEEDAESIFKARINPEQFTAETQRLS